MRYIRIKDYDEVALKREFYEEFLYSQEAIRVKSSLQLNRNDMGGADLCNLYHITRRYEYPYFSDIVRNAVKNFSGLSILDVGCGTSYAPFSFSRSSRKYVGIDLYDLTEFYANLSPNITFSRHDITQAAYSVNEFDLVISISVLEHIPRELRLKAFENIVLSLKAGGLFAFTFDVDLEGHGSGFTFDEVYETIFQLDELGLVPCEKIDLTLYDDLVTTECAMGLPGNRYQLPWRLSKTQINTLLNKVMIRLGFGLVKQQTISIGVVRGCFKKK